MPQKRFPGPCIICNLPDPTGYYKKHMCNNCYRKEKRKANPPPPLPKKYPGPCSNCGSETSSNGRFIAGLCLACYKRLNNSGNTEPRQKYTGPCTVCGTTAEGKYYRKMCRPCYKKADYAAKVKSKKKYCQDCNIEIYRLSKRDRCSKCHYKYNYANNPEFKNGFRRRAENYLSSSKGKKYTARWNEYRRVKLANVHNDLKESEWQLILKYYKNCCAYCDKYLEGDDLTKDHVTPLAKGGPHTASNIVPACRSCNGRKHKNKPPKEVKTYPFDLT